MSAHYQGFRVQIRGIVTADFDQSSGRGFYVQTENCDSDPSTSDGIFIYLAERVEVVSMGDRVQVWGIVQEYYGMSEILAVPQDILVLSQSNPLPAPVELTPPFENARARPYFESLEGMFVKLDQGLVIGPTDADDRTWLVRFDLGLPRVFQDDPAGTGEVLCVDDGGLFEIAPEATVGVRLQSLLGVLDFRGGVYCLELISAPVLLTSAPDLSPAELQPAGDPLFSLATFNLANLFDTLNDPLTDDQVLSNTEYQRRLRKRALAISQELHHPALLAVQEAENAAVLQDLAARPEIQANYTVYLEEGPDKRGLDLGLLYRTDLVELVEAYSRQGCTNLADGLGPDGNDEPENPQNNLTCDWDADGRLDGNRLFSRPPLIAHLRVRPVEADGRSEDRQSPAVGEDFWVVVCHWKSKVEDSSTVEYTSPRRLLQAQFVAGLVREIHQSYPQTQLVVLGDFNDYPASQPMKLLTAEGLQSGMGLVGRASRYTYIYRGLSQVLDDILFMPQWRLIPARFGAAHIDADYPDAFSSQSDNCLRSSDHDPLFLDFATANLAAFLPLVRR